MVVPLQPHRKLWRLPHVAVVWALVLCSVVPLEGRRSSNTTSGTPTMTFKLASTPSDTPSPSVSTTYSPSPSPSLSTTVSAVVRPTETLSAGPSMSATGSVSATSSLRSSDSVTVAGSPSASGSPTSSPSSSASYSLSVSMRLSTSSSSSSSVSSTSSFSSSLSGSTTPSCSVRATASRSLEATDTHTVRVSISSSGPSGSGTASLTVSPRSSGTVSASATSTASNSGSPTASTTSSSTASRTIPAVMTGSDSPTATSSTSSSQSSTSSLSPSWSGSASTSVSVAIPVTSTNSFSASSVSSSRSLATSRTASAAGSTSDTISGTGSSSSTASASSSTSPSRTVPLRQTRTGTASASGSASLSVTASRTVPQRQTRTGTFSSTVSSSGSVTPSRTKHQRQTRTGTLSVSATSSVTVAQRRTRSTFSMTPSASPSGSSTRTRPQRPTRSGSATWSSSPSKTKVLPRTKSSASWSTSPSGATLSPSGTPSGSGTVSPSGTSSRSGVASASKSKEGTYHGPNISITSPLTATRRLMPTLSDSWSQPSWSDSVSGPSMTASGVRSVTLSSSVTLSGSSSASTSASHTGRISLSPSRSVAPKRTASTVSISFFPTPTDSVTVTRRAVPTLTKNPPPTATPNITKSASISVSVRLTSTKTDEFTSTRSVSVSAFTKTIGPTISLTVVESTRAPLPPTLPPLPPTPKSRTRTPTLIVLTTTTAAPPTTTPAPNTTTTAAPTPAPTTKPKSKTRSFGITRTMTQRGRSHSTSPSGSYTWVGVNRSSMSITPALAVFPGFGGGGGGTGGGNGGGSGNNNLFYFYNREAPDAPNPTGVDSLAVGRTGSMPLVLALGTGPGSDQWDLTIGPLWSDPAAAVITTTTTAAPTMTPNTTTPRPTSPPNGTNGSHQLFAPLDVNTGAVNRGIMLAAARSFRPQASCGTVTMLPSTPLAPGQTFADVMVPGGFLASGGQVFVSSVNSSALTIQLWLPWMTGTTGRFFHHGIPTAPYMPMRDENIVLMIPTLTCLKNKSSLPAPLVFTIYAGAAPGTSTLAGIYGQEIAPYPWFSTTPKRVAFGLHSAASISAVGVAALGPILGSVLPPVGLLVPLQSSFTMLNLAYCETPWTLPPPWYRYPLQFELSAASVMSVEGGAVLGNLCFPLIFLVLHFIVIEIALCCSGDDGDASGDADVVPGPGDKHTTGARSNRFVIAGDDDDDDVSPARRPPAAAAAVPASPHPSPPREASTSKRRRLRMYKQLCFPYLFLVVGFWLLSPTLASATQLLLSAQPILLSTNANTVTAVSSIWFKVLSTVGSPGGFIILATVAFLVTLLCHGGFCGGWIVVWRILYVGKKGQLEEKEAEEKRKDDERRRVLWLEMTASMQGQGGPALPPPVVASEPLLPHMIKPSEIYMFPRFAIHRPDPAEDVPGAAKLLMPPDIGTSSPGRPNAAASPVSNKAGGKLTVERDVIPDDQPGEESVVALVYLWLKGAYRWHSDDDDGSETLLYRWGSVFLGLEERAKWWFLFEWLFAIIVALIDGLRLTSAPSATTTTWHPLCYCSRNILTLLVFEGIRLLALLVVRPFSSLVTLIIVAFVAIMNLVSGILLLLVLNPLPNTAKDNSIVSSVLTATSDSVYGKYATRLMIPSLIGVSVFGLWALLGSLWCWFFTFYTKRSLGLTVDRPAPAPRYQLAKVAARRREVLGSPEASPQSRGRDRGFMPPVLPAKEEEPFDDILGDFEMKPPRPGTTAAAAPSAGQAQHKPARPLIELVRQQQHEQHAAAAATPSNPLPPTRDPHRYHETPPPAPSEHRPSGKHSRENPLDAW